MDRARRQELIDRYADGHRVVLDAVCGATDRELDARPPDGSWTAREVVHHLADSEMTSAIRLRRLLAEAARPSTGTTRKRSRGGSATARARSAPRSTRSRPLAAPPPSCSPC
jgi:hypothetical protein